MAGLKVARALTIWFHRSFGKAGTQFKPGPFMPPADPSAQLRQLQTDIEKLRHDLQQANVELDSSQQFSQLIEKEKAEYEALAIAMDEARFFQSLVGPNTGSGSSRPLPEYGSLWQRNMLSQAKLLYNLNSSASILKQKWKHVCYQVFHRQGYLCRFGGY